MKKKYNEDLLKEAIEYALKMQTGAISYLTRYYYDFLLKGEETTEGFSEKELKWDNALINGKNGEESIHLSLKKHLYEKKFKDSEINKNDTCKEEQTREEDKKFIEEIKNGMNEIDIQSKKPTTYLELTNEGWIKRTPTLEDKISDEISILYNKLISIYEKINPCKKIKLEVKCYSDDEEKKEDDNPKNLSEEEKDQQDLKGLKEVIRNFMEENKEDFKNFLGNNERVQDFLLEKAIKN